MLSKRQKNIILQLIHRGSPVLIEDLSEMFSVSNRSIKTDVKDIKLWLKRYEVRLETKPNKGIWLVWEKEIDMLSFHQKLLMETVNEDLFSVENRIQRTILILLLDKTAFIPASMIADYIEVSDKTVYSDVKQIGEFLEKHGLVIDTGSGRGYAILGNETDIRALAEYLLIERFANYHLNISKSLLKIKHFLGSLTPSITGVVDTVFEKYNLLANSDYSIQLPIDKSITMLLRLVIAKLRMKKGFILKIRKTKYGDLDKNLLTILSLLGENLDGYPAFEVDYIIKSSYHASLNESAVVTIVNHVIDDVSQTLMIPFYEDDLLKSNLMSHITNKFSDRSIDLFKHNPFLNELKTKHDYLYEPVQQACKKYIKQDSLIPNELISSFITLHFLVSLETNFVENKPLKALYVCATGRGVARIVKYRVEREISQLKVAEYCGVDEVDDKLKPGEFDLVISVIPLNITLPLVWVQAVPTNQNIEDIKVAVKKIAQDKGRYIYQPIPIPKQAPENNDAREVSKEIILKSMEVYHDLKEAFNKKIKKDLEEAFLMHIFLMIHRIYFSEPYDQLKGDQMISSKNYNVVDQIFKKYQLEANHDEKYAILFYIEEDECVSNNRD